MQEFVLQNQWIIWLVIAWTIPWKAVALWKAARNSDKIWFGALFIFNTLAILEIIYIFIFGKKKKGNGGSNYPAVQNGNGTNLIRGL